MKYSKKDVERVSNLILQKKLGGGTDTVYRHGLNRQEDRGLVIHCLRKLVTDGKLKLWGYCTKKDFKEGHFAVDIFKD